jgi:hypothetical protein
VVFELRLVQREETSQAKLKVVSAKDISGSKAVKRGELSVFREQASVGRAQWTELRQHEVTLEGMSKNRLLELSLGFMISTMGSLWRILNILTCVKLTGVRTLECKRKKPLGRLLQ